MSIEEAGPHELGRLGERFAAAHLRRDRMQLLERNWKHRLGEIDLIARQRDVVVFCEVKTRRSERYGGPLAAVDGEKLRRVDRLARAWLKEHCRSSQPWRVDRMGLTVADGSRIVLEHRWGIRHGLQPDQHGLHDRDDRGGRDR
ncbi:YraN family protein [Glycomyces sp. L485]|uniref:YraN family protein n=1 Tax=Glycomyces sp. L485 TaxID=2909235 RepID=UPI001F4AD19D|nr:YraN family protein [Glycomyces sp. L485]MCH7230461.1 YraN family protein [Glycomyces sp. L485]